MELTLITGPDGSGKSTLLNKIEAGLPNKAHILRVPTVDLELFKVDSMLHSTAEFINYLGKRADQNKEYSFKIISIFGAMSIFGKLYQHLVANKNQPVFAERHPLIDTAVYAQAYLSIMNPEFLEPNETASIEQTYPAQLDTIINSIKPELQRTSKGPCYDLLNFLHQFFLRDVTNPTHQLMELFETPIPSKIYFLAAQSKTLSNRIEQRERREYHESEAALAKMEKMYLKVLKTSTVPFEIISTENWDASNKLAHKLIASHA